MSPAPARQRGPSRCRSAEATLAYAKRLAPTAGITEVVDITDRDRIGIPVFASVRPRSRADVVTFGKGPEPVDAEVSAYMEAIEFYFAEPGVSAIRTRWGRAHDISGADRVEDAILDFIPLHGKHPDLEAPLLLASAIDLESGEEALVPAELVFRPAPDIGQTLFGSSTNGLASGNSLEETSLFSLLELMERDIWSIELARQTSLLVAPQSLPDDVREIAERVERQGLGLKTRAVPNAYGLPFFASFLFDPRTPRFETFNGGWGCAFDPAAALTQSVMEAAQSRLGFIHGGRNQADKLARKFAPGGASQAATVVSKQIDKVSDDKASTSFADIPGVPTARPIADQLDALVRILRRVSDAPIHRVVYTSADSPLQVVRLIVATLEHYKPGKVRVGRRLRAALRGSMAAANGS